MSFSEDGCWLVTCLWASRALATAWPDGETSASVFMQISQPRPVGCRRARRIVGASHSPRTGSFPSIRQSPPRGCPRCGTSPRSWRLLSNTRQTRARYRPLRLLSAKLFEQGGDLGGEHRHRADRPPHNLTRGNARENPDRATAGHKTVPIGGKSAGRRPSPLASYRDGPATACCCPYLGYVTSSCPALSTTSDLGHPLAETQPQT